MWDFPQNKEIQDLAEAIYKKGGYIASVCHGIAGLLNLTDHKGEPLIKGRQITGFTNLEEVLNRTRHLIPFKTETELIKKGASFKKTFPFRAYALVDGHVITGQNPQSASAVTKLLIQELRNQGEHY